MQNFETIFTTVVISVMSFFGWSIDEYKNALPQTFNQIAEELQQTLDSVEKSHVIENIIPSIQKTGTTTLETKTPQPTKPVPIIKSPVREKPNTPVTIPTLPKPQEPKPNLPIHTEPAQNISSEQRVKSAVGNIFCTTIIGNKIQKITGSAVAISNNGVILTNAHVAEHLLLENTKARNSSCFVRTGGPANRAYKARVVFLPEEWVSRNKDNLKYTNVSGTGEHDYAIIVLDEKINTTADNLSFIEPNSKQIRENQQIILAGYPAFNGNIIDNALYPVVDKASIKQLFDLKDSPNALVDTDPTILAIHGSSGGAVSDTESNLIGIMVATILDTETQKPSIRFISIDYIKNDFEEKTGKTFNQVIKNADSEATTFLAGKGAELANTLISNSR